jgi:hypothetical protein
MGAKTQYPKRIVLGNGYPWAYGIGPYFEVGLNEGSMGLSPMALKWHKKLWRKDVPQYRLVLEIVDTEDA